MSVSGLKPQKASNLVKAIAISGLWFGSVKLEGSFLCSSDASSLFYEVSVLAAWITGGARLTGCN